MREEQSRHKRSFLEQKWVSAKNKQQLELSIQSGSPTRGSNYSDDNDSVDSNFDPEIPTIEISRSVDGLTGLKSLKSSWYLGSAVDGESNGAQQQQKYDEETIIKEFKTYKSILPKPDKLLQEKHSFSFLRNKIEKTGSLEIPRFLRYKFEGGIKPHQALCCLLLSEYHEAQKMDSTKRKQNSIGKTMRITPFLVRVLSFGYLHVQLNNPADFIRDQFYRCAPAVPTEAVTSDILRMKIKNRGLPVPNYFLDPDDPRQFPPHIALLVILQDKEKTSRKFDSILNRLAFSIFALVALLLRIVLEVIGGAGAIWGGAEVFGLRTEHTRELWRWISVAVGILCFLRFVTLNAPQKEDEGGILGPAGPWSLRLSVRLRAVCDHPFHYFVRALPPCSPPKKKD